MAGKGDTIASPSKPSKFSAYQNPALSAVLTENSRRPSRSAVLFIFSIFFASAITLLTTVSKEEGFNVTQLVAGVVFVGTLWALIRAVWLGKSVAGVPAGSLCKGTHDLKLSQRQLGLLGLKPKSVPSAESAKKPPKSRPYTPSSPSETLVPLHNLGSSPNRWNLIGSNRSNGGGISTMGSHYTPSKSPGSTSSFYLVPSPSSVKTSPGLDRVVSTPWSKQRGSAGKEIATEEMLEEFLADVDEKITASAEKLATPPPTVGSFGINSPSTVGNSAANTSGTTRSTPLRPVRMSPSTQKFSTPPKKREGDLPSAMSMEETIEAFQNIGVYPQIEQWRDRLRQWFSAVLLNPLLNKVETSHIQVMQAAAKLGVSITVNQVGSDPATVAPAKASPIDGTKEWQQVFTLDEDALLHQLHATLVQALDLPAPKLPISNLFQPQTVQQNPLVPVMRECLDAVTEHQRLQALMKGEWVKGLLPQSSVRADYTVQRISELAEGTCLKNYEYLGSGEVYDKVNKKWTLELPTDSHLLLYLFCAFLEHPKWMLHVDPTSYVSAQSSKNPLFLGFLPPKERFPEKYVAVISGVPVILHPGACILVVGKQSPPLFALYWDKKLQFSLQGRTALWDATLLLCHKIKLSYGGVVHGIHLGSSAFNILPVIDPETEE